MLRLHARFALSLAPLFLVAACSSGSSDGNSSADGGGDSDAPGAPLYDFAAKYCTATLLTEQHAAAAKPGLGWSGSAPVAAGTTFFVTPYFGVWSGYIIGSDGSVQKIDSDAGGHGLVKGTDFTSDCAPDAVPSEFDHDVARQLVLQTATIYPNADLSGQACTVPAGTDFTGDFSVSGGSTTASVQAGVLKSICGYDRGYATLFPFGPLIVR
jgi:hypothetical protein